KDTSKGSCCIPVDDDLPCGLVHWLQHKGIVLCEVRRGILVACLDRRPVEIRSLNLLSKLLTQGGFDSGEIHLQKLRSDANVYHVLDQLAQLRLRTDCSG